MHKQKTTRSMRVWFHDWSKLLQKQGGAESRNRTGTLLLARDFESRASTSSAIPARGATVEEYYSAKWSPFSSLRGDY